jgi:hypothetical protein
VRWGTAESYDLGGGVQRRASVVRPFVARPRLEGGARRARSEC